MASDNNGIPEVYIFQGHDGEEVPENVEELTFKPDVQVLPEALCYERRRLKRVTLPKGLRVIGNGAFYGCRYLSEINEIPTTVQSIGEDAFYNCFRLRLTKSIITSSPAPHELQIIGKAAFYECRSLQRIKPPSSVTAIHELAFNHCRGLLEVNLSTTDGLTAIPSGVFAGCHSLQTASLPNTVRWIGNGAFAECEKLVTVVVPLDSKSIRIDDWAFNLCKSLANLALPRGSIAHANAFEDCKTLHRRFGTSSNNGIVKRLIGRFDRLDLHKLCYNHPRPTAQALRQCIRQCIRQRFEEQDQQMENLFKDIFGMTPFHVLFSTPEPNMELLEVLLEWLPNRFLKLKDANGKRPIDYLFNNLTDGTKSLLHKTLQKSMVDRVDRWGATLWMKTMQGKVQEILAAEDDEEQRTRLCKEAYSALEHFENQEVTSVLEMAMWKWKLTTKSGCAAANDSSKRQALDREECRFLSGSDVAIPHVSMFLDTPLASSEEEDDSSEYSSSFEQDDDSSEYSSSAEEEDDSSVYSSSPSEEDEFTRMLIVDSLNGNIHAEEDDGSVGRAFFFCEEGNY